MVERAVTLQLPRKLSFLMDMHPYKIAYGGRNSLKCLGLGTKVYMADGRLRSVEDIQLGEYVLGPDSFPRRVLSIGRGTSDLFLVKQTSGMSYVVNGAHILSLKRSRSSKLPQGKLPTGNHRWPNGRYSGWPDTVNINVREYVAQSERWKAHFRGYRAGVLKFKERPLRIEPYFLGLWLGDGTAKCLQITNIDKEVVTFCEEFAARNGCQVSLGKMLGTEARRIMFPRLGRPGRSGRGSKIWTSFQSYGLPSNKHIPDDFLFNSVENRLELLAGLIDTDGTRHGQSGYAISQVNERLARDIKRLADSLGFRTSLKLVPTICTHKGAKIVGKTWNIHIYGHAWRVPCKIARKRINPNTPEPAKEYLQSKLTITALGLGEFAGFELDGDHLFCLEDGTVTHNSHSFAGALLTLGIAQDLRILCGREIQKSLRESAHQLLQDKIEALHYEDLYDVTDEAIRSRVTNTLFRFTGLADHTIDSIKSYERFDIAWLEESHSVTKRSRQVLFPTIFRTPNAEIWESFNPGMDTDDVWERYVVNPPAGAKVVEMNYRDAIACGWWTNEQEQLRQYDLVYSKQDYDNIWEGKPRSTVAGAIYTSEITDMARERRYQPMPYDPRLPVHRIWDLGWNDLMVVIMVQKPTHSSLVVINYFEDRFIKYSDILAAMDGLRYKWGDDWLPHDSSQHHPTSGTNAYKQIMGLTGKRPKDIPKSDPEARIRAARMMFPRVYVDNSKRDAPPDRPDRLVGAGHLMDRLKRYKRHVPKSKELDGEAAGPVHDITSHGADAWGGLAEIVDRIRNTDEQPIERLPAYSNVEPSMGTLG